MRQLTSKQKKLLDEAYLRYSPSNVDELTAQDWERLQAINDTEILWQEVNRYLWDKRFSRN